MIVHVLILWGVISAAVALGVVVHRRTTGDDTPEYQSALTFVGAAYGLLLGLLVVCTTPPARLVGSSHSEAPPC